MKKTFKSVEKVFTLKRQIPLNELNEIVCCTMAHQLQWSRKCNQREKKIKYQFLKTTWENLQSEKFVYNFKATVPCLCYNPTYILYLYEQPLSEDTVTCSQVLQFTTDRYGTNQINRFPLSILFRTTVTAENPSNFIFIHIISI